ncbi:hypothetical protein Focb16_v006044 [Fusarium oxysporum f. sp. cubense]|uniref:Zn(2)-C6 fungal-type domain-containing protein n=1 Tax=Fusarium oxysporum f. sp. cubense TaxID=61366 RepID=A0A559LJW6_FUSOC|nr:hypothetical protein Focb16_v006044 [Fusarium oxysporum f. sp. cubense]
MEPSKQHSSPVAHNRLAESPSQGRRIVTIKVPQRNNGYAGSKEPIASQQKQALSRTKELDTLLQVPMKESTTDKLTGITIYGTTPGTERIISSPFTSSQLEQNVGVMEKTKQATFQTKGKPTCFTPQIDRPDISWPPDRFPICNYQQGLGAYENYIQPAPFSEATAGSASHHPHYLSYEQPPPQGILGNAEQSLNLQGYFKQDDTSVPDGVNDEDNDSLVYEVETQCAIVKLTFFQSCQPCRIEKKDCNGEIPCDKCTSFGEDCKYEIESESKGRGVEKRRFFKACNRCEDIKAKRDGQKPCDGQYPCGSCIDLKTQCIYSVKPEMFTDLATENIALLSRRVKELATQRGLIAAILRPYSRVRQSIAKFYGGISKGPRYKKQKR